MSSTSPNLTAHTLLQHEDFVQAIARKLLSNEDEVQDVVQETWLRALKNPPRQSSSLRSWLGRVVQNLARDRYRSESRREGREQAVARPEEETLDVSQSRLEGHRKVVDAVLALEEPYKSVVLLAYYQELPPTRIAERLGRNPATVRSQLHRAHELLRERMDDEFGGHRGAWAALLLPFDKVAPGGSLPTGSAAASKSLWASSGGALTMAGILAALAIVVPLLLKSADEPERSELANAKTTAPPTLTVAAAPPLEASEEVPASATVPVVTTPPTRALASTESSLTVVVRDGKKLAEGVDVWLLEVSDVDPDEVTGARDEFMDPMVLYRRFGTHAVSNSDGEVAFEWSGEQAGILATTTRRQAEVVLKPGDKAHLEIDLKKVSEVLVEVVDSEGKPQAGVRVSLDATNVEHDSRSTIFLHRTEPLTGRTVFRAFTDEDNERIQWEEGTKLKYSLKLDVPGVNSRELSFNAKLKRKHGRPFQFVLDPTGSLIVRAVDANGAVLKLDGSVSVVEAGARRGSSWSSARAPLVDGIATIQHVGLGRAYEIFLSSADSGIDWRAQELGPKSGGQAATIDVVAPNRKRLTGRILDTDGKPMKKANLTMFTGTAEVSNAEQQDFRTDEQGRFSVELEEDLPDGTQLRALFLRTSYGSDIRADPADLITLSGVTNELGDLRMRSVERELRVRFVDGNGEPVVGLRLLGKQDWLAFGTGGTSDRNGLARMRGLWQDPPSFSIMFSERWVLPADLSLKPGPKVNEVVLIEGGHIKGSVLSDPDALEPTYYITAYDESGARDASWSAFFQLGAGETEFDLAGLPTGTYSLRLNSSSGNATLVTVEGIGVRATETTFDPRLQNIDLRGLMQTRSFQVTDARGALIRSASAQAFSQGAFIGLAKRKGPEWAIELKDPTATVLLVGATGYLPRIVEASNLPDTIRLEPGLPVRLFSSQHPVVTMEKAQLMLSLRRIAADSRLGEATFDAYLPLAIASLDPGEDFPLILPGPGTYVLFSSVHREAGGGMMFSSSAEPVPGNFTIEVREEDAGERIELRLPDSFFD